MVEWSTPDLADVSNVLSGLLTNAFKAANITNVKVSCDSPDSARDDTTGLCILTLYLLHVGRDPYWRNTPVAGPQPRLNSAQPLSLNLSYLLTAYHKNDFATEQRAMSVALQTFHSQPIVTPGVIQAGGLSQWLPTGEFTVSIEADTIEEMSRLWQAITAPIRLSALIRAAIVFLAPAKVQPAPYPSPTIANLAVSPGPATAPQPILLAGGGVAVQPALAGSDPLTLTAAAGPVTAVSGGYVVIGGNALTLSQAAQVFLRPAGGTTDWDVTAWLQSPAQATQIGLTMPAAYADVSSEVPVPPGATPLPGLYTLTVGSTALSTRSNAVPLAVAPRVDGVTQPAQLNPNAAGVYTVKGGGFVPSATILAVGKLALSQVSVTPQPGQFAIDGPGTTITFMLPTPKPAPGDYPVLIQVNGIVAAPGWVVVVPAP